MTIENQPYPAKDKHGRYMPYDIKKPAIKLARRIQALMADVGENTVINAEIRQFNEEWYLSIAHGKWEKLGA